jgi:hypothetical protein
MITASSETPFHPPASLCHFTSLRLDGRIPRTSRSQLAYAGEFRSATEAAARAAVIGPSRPGTAALLPACYKHCNTEDSGFSELATHGVTLEAATAAWYNGLLSAAAAASPGSAGGDLDHGGGDDGIPPFLVEQCLGLNCGSSCPALPPARQTGKYHLRETAFGDDNDDAVVILIQSLVV